MYSVDDLDEVIEIQSLPQSSVGSPAPAVIGTERQISLVYYLEDSPEDWDATSVIDIDDSSSGEPIAIVKFDFCKAHMFGPPNDEAFSGHPLADRGLSPYSVFQIKNSSWVRKLEIMNSVHQRHSADQYKLYNHYVFTFHDSTFECVARGYEFEKSYNSIAKIISNIALTIK